jgi:hypothetical protein
MLPVAHNSCFHLQIFSFVMTQIHMYSVLAILLLIFFFHRLGRFGTIVSSESGLWKQVTGHREPSSHETSIKFIFDLGYFKFQWLFQI